MYLIALWWSVNNCLFAVLFSLCFSFIVKLLYITILTITFLIVTIIITTTNITADYNVVFKLHMR